MIINRSILYISLLLLFMPQQIFAEAQLDDELTQALNRKPDVQAGKEVYKLCIACHGAEGWGTRDGEYPQLAGQHSTVIIKQIADIRAGNRDNPKMYPIAKETVMGGPQAIADVTAYIATLKMDPEPEVGEGENLEKAEKLFFRKCAECHGPDGGGDASRYYPRIQGQHYEYLLRQLQWIREGKRKNANKDMARRLAKLKPADLELLADYVSRLEPPADEVAPYNWKNPDFNP